MEVDRSGEVGVWEKCPKLFLVLRINIFINVEGYTNFLFEIIHVEKKN